MPNLNNGFFTRKRRSVSTGASLVEVTVGLFIMIPMFICIIDLSAIVIGQIVNDGLAKRAARAAAHQRDATAANNAAQNVVNAYQVNGIVSQANLQQITFNQGNSGNVVIQTRVRINVPAPIAFVPLLQSGRDMDARATEPIVMLPAGP